MRRANYCSMFLIAMTVLSGCSLTVKERVDFDPYEPIRVAVVPFYEVDSDGKVVNSDEVIFQRANLPQEIREQEDPHSAIVYTTTLRALSGTSFDIVPAGVVTSYLVHNGYTKGVTYDYERIAKESPKKLCDLLQCDAILYGRILDWSQTYYGLESVTTVELELKLVRAADGKVLFETTVEDHDSRGLTKVPTGYISLALEPIKGLSDAIAVKLADRVIERAVQPLLPKANMAQIDAPSPSIFATTHSAPDGTVKRGAPFTVLATGSPGSTATFSIGEIVTNVPMVEVDRMHYVGEFYPLANDSFDKQNVKVSFADRYGRSMEQVISLGPVSLR